METPLAGASSHSLEYSGKTKRSWELFPCHQLLFRPSLRSARKTVGGWQRVCPAEGIKCFRKENAALGIIAMTQGHWHGPEWPPCHPVTGEFIWLGCHGHLHCRSDFKNRWLCLHAMLQFSVTRQQFISTGWSLELKGEECADTTFLKDL